jgi:hypothetical protein
VKILINIRRQGSSPSLPWAALPCGLLICAILPMDLFDSIVPAMNNITHWLVLSWWYSVHDFLDVHLRPRHSPNCSNVQGSIN